MKKVVFVLISLSIFHYGCNDSSTTELIHGVDYKKYNIVFTKYIDGLTEIYTIKSDGSELKKITQIQGLGFTPQWSHDGTHIVFAVENNPNHEFFIVDSAGANLSKIGEGQQFICSPFENKICYTMISDGNWYNAFVIWEVHLMNMDGSNKTKLTDTKYQKFYPLWSPIDSLVSFNMIDNISGNFQNIYTLNIYTKSCTILVEGYESALLTDWSDITNSILFSCGDADIHKLDLNSFLVTQLTQNTGGRNERAKISPKGDKILFDSNRSQGSQIYVMNYNGSNQINISNSIGYNYSAQWSPDGTLIAYLSMTNSGQSRIRIMSENGNGNRLLTNTEGIETGFDWY